MTKQIRSVAVVVCLIAGVILTTRYSRLGAQSAPLPSRIDLTNTVSYPGVTAEPFNPLQHTAYSELFQLADWQPVGPFAIVITNGTDRPLKGVVVRWQRQLGQTTGWNVFQSDSYVRQDQAPVILPHSSAMVTPTGFLTKEAVQGHFITAAKPGPEVMQSLASQNRIVVEFDSVVLDDDAVVGADLFGIVAYLRGRQIAAQALLDEIQREGESIQPGDAMLELQTHLAGPFDTDTARWLQRLSNSIVGMPSVDMAVQYLTRMARVPQLSH